MTPRDPRGHAVVLGAGMAGLLAAAILSEFYETVTVAERDWLPPNPAQRKGVPQGRHLHRLLSRGSQLLEEFFPGILEELVAAGAQIDDCDLSRMYVRIGQFGLPRSGYFREPAALVTYATTRPLLEFHVRRRVIALGNVRVLDGHDIVEAIAHSPRRVTGVRLVERRGGDEVTVDADLVVDAMGRASRTPALLKRLGYAPAPQQRCTAQATYASHFLRMPTDTIAERLMMVAPQHHKPGGLLAAAEHDTWVLSIGQLSSDWETPANLTQMLALTEQFAPPSIMTGLRCAEPIGDVAVFRYRGASWWRYDKMMRFPAGLLVIGDALCALNPTYGQGMTVAALQALALRDHVCAGPTQPQRFFSAAARHIDPVWSVNQARDHPPSIVENRFALSKRLQKWTVTQAIEAARNDAMFAEHIMRVNHLVDPPARMRDPRLVARMVAANARRRVASTLRPALSARGATDAE